MSVKKITKYRKKSVAPTAKIYEQKDTQSKQDIQRIETTTDSC